MDLKFITENFVPVIVVACVLVGYIIKVTPPFAKVANNYIPLIVTVLGTIASSVRPFVRTPRIAPRTVTIKGI